MDINACFPSKYVKAADLGGADVNVSISSIAMEYIGDDGQEKSLPVVYFAGQQKGLVLNKTNAGTIADIYGSDTDRWVGQSVTLFPTTTDFKGKSTPCIRVKVHPPSAVQQPAVQPPVVTQPQAAPLPVSTPQTAGPQF